MKKWLTRMRKLVGWPVESELPSSLACGTQMNMNYTFAYDLSFRTEGGDYNYVNPGHGEAARSVDDLVDKLVKTRPFRRLHGIRFLGALDYCLIAHPNGARNNIRYTRAQHSIGVAYLARKYLDTQQFSEKDEMLCVAAALLHDIGHAPFSHTLEPVLKKHFGLDHHQATERVILGQEYSDEITKVLWRFGISPSEIVEILSGNDEKFSCFFSGPINFDTIEGILRSRAYLRMQTLGLTPARVLRASIERRSAQDQAVVDAFWTCKDEVYNVVIRSKTGVLYDAIFQAAAEYCIGEFDRSDYFLTESQSFQKHPALKEAAQARYWEHIVKSLLPDELAYQARTFYIHEEARFFDRCDKNRYRQHKLDMKLSRADMLGD